MNAMNGGRVLTLAFTIVLCGGVHGQLTDSIWIQGDAVNRPCQTTNDCLQEGARCFNGQCLCLTTHINVQGRCLPSWITLHSFGDPTCAEIKPGQSQCLYDEQCTAVWPRTRCVNSICQCDRSAVQVRTRDGIVCMHEYGSLDCLISVYSPKQRRAPSAVATRCCATRRAPWRVAPRIRRRES